MFCFSKEYNSHKQLQEFSTSVKIFLRIILLQSCPSLIKTVADLSCVCYFKRLAVSICSAVTDFLYGAISGKCIWMSTKRKHLLYSNCFFKPCISYWMYGKHWTTHQALVYYCVGTLSIRINDNTSVLDPCISSVQ